MIDRRTLVKLLVGAAGVLVLAAACGVLLREPLTLWGGRFIEAFGLPGLLVGVLVADSSIVPMTNEPLVLLAISGGVDPWTAGLVTATGSVLAGPVGWLCGRTVARHTRLGAVLAHRNPGVVALLTRFGGRFVAAAALLPFPFAVSTWLAGAAGVPLSHVLAASLLRIPKTAFYVALLAGGWAVGA